LFRLVGPVLAAFWVFASLLACDDSDGSDGTFYIAGIPDQHATKLARRYKALTAYLSEELGVAVEYVPTIDYAATVVGFKRGDIHMAWFGGLTGVQARLAVPDSVAIAQRPIDTEFHSRFIVQSGLDIANLADLKGLTFTFGSESSTSGHLMPRHFMIKAGVNPDTDLDGLPNFSGSHDKTWKLVESGAFQAGALNEAVWEAALQAERIDTDKVTEFYTTPAYFDYNWTIRGDSDARFGNGFIERVRWALITLGEDNFEILELFSTESFIETDNSNYTVIDQIAKSLGIVK